MACQAWQQQIGTYIDGELPAAQEDALRLHLRGCAACASEALAGVQLKQAVRGAGRRYAPTAEFSARIHRQASGRRPWWSRSALAALAVAAVLAVVVGLGWVQWARRSQGKQVVAELADLHVANLASANPVEVASSDRHTVKPWFQGRLPFTFDLPEVAGSPFVLAGGRVTYLQHMPGAQLVFDLRRHHISVFIFRETPALGQALPDEAFSSEAGFNLETWKQNGLRYFVIGDAGREDIQALSVLLKRAGRM